MTVQVPQELLGWQVFELGRARHPLELPQNKIFRNLKKMDHLIGLSERCNIEAGVRIYFLLQEGKAQGEGRLVLELESGGGDLEDTAPAEGERPAVGAVNQNLQL